MSRELGPLITAIVVIAVPARLCRRDRHMKVTEEIDALETMASARCISL